MAHIAFLSPPESGHLNPTLPIARELVARGHRVSYPAPASVADRVRETGAQVLPYDRRPSEPIVIDGMDAAARATLALLQDLEYALPQIEAGYAGDRPDLIVNDWLAWEGAMLAAKWDVPRVQSWSAHAASEGYDFGQFIVGMFAASPIRAEFDALLATVLDRHGIPPFELHDFYRPAASNLVYQPRSFHVHNETFDDRYAFVGPTRTSDPEGWTPPGRPLVYVSLGTIISDPAFFRTCVAAFTGQPYQVVLSVGRDLDPTDLGPLPAGIEAHQHVPQPAVLAHTDVFVTHTGMNSTMEALAAAVPMVAVPHTPEQQTTADRVAELGLGRCLSPAEATPDRLRAAVRDLLDDAATKQRLRAMQRDVHAAGGAPRAADTIETRLTTAKTPTAP
ncbi:macrolide family glycosyltransferase [Actinomadura terrae]|uniref:macrolide family glycosyltransferase n=1 Tax=Actinomadura terrae TaxID=604353 RepID=UPI001FA742CB|nr:macrolide family glycosyltransferase [Actinomadura terrae]